MQAFFDALDNKRRAKVLAMIRLLEEQGPTLPFPYSSQVQGKIRELRTHYGDDHYRVLYFGAPGRVFVLLHALEKRSAKISEQDVRIAAARMRRYLEEDRR